jgi:hypothetical protein
MEPKRTPGQAEGTQEDADNALDQDQQRRQARAVGAHQREQAALSREPGRTPGQAEGTTEQAEGSLRNRK